MWARDASSGSSYDAFSAFQSSLTVGPCTTVGTTSFPATAATVGNNVTISAGSAGCGNPLYEFWLQSPDGRWAPVQGYSTSSTYIWKTVGLAGGSYRFSVWARDASSGGMNGAAPNTYDAFAAFQYTLA